MSQEEAMIRRIISVAAAFSLVFVPSASHASEDICSSIPDPVRDEINRQISTTPGAVQEVVKYGWNC